MVDFNFNAAEVPEAEKTDFDVIPQGTHQMMITDSEIKKSESGSEGLNITCKITSGPFENRLVWTYINTVKKDGTKNEYGMQSIAQICHAVGLESFSDTTELHNSIFSGTIKHEQYNGEAQARIANYAKPKDMAALADASAPTF